MYILQSDLTQYLRLSGIYYTQMCNDFVKQLKYGGKCIDCLQDKLFLFKEYIEALECYNVYTGGSGYYKITNNANSRHILFTITIYVNNVSIGSVTTNSNDPVATMQQLAININDYQSDYTAVYNSLSQQIDITSDITKIPADNGELSFHTTWTALESTISGLEGGIDNTDNCYTEDQIKQIINNIEKLTGCCFQTLGFQYITE